MRSQGKTWVQVATELEYHQNTVRKYAMITGWDALVDYWRERLWNESLSKLISEGTLEALSALRDQWQHHQGNALEAQETLIDLELDRDPDTIGERAALRRQLAYESRAVAAAADRFLHNSGARKLLEERAKYQAEAEHAPDPDAIEEAGYDHGELDEEGTSEVAAILAQLHANGQIAAPGDT